MPEKNLLRPAPARSPREIPPVLTTVNNTTEVSGSESVNKIVVLSQSEYNLISGSAANNKTLYFIAED